MSAAIDGKAGGSRRSLTGSKPGPAGRPQASRTGSGDRPVGGAEHGPKSGAGYGAGYWETNRVSETTNAAARLKAAAPAGAAALGVVAAVVGATLLTRGNDTPAPEVSMSPAVLSGPASPGMAPPDVQGPPPQSAAPQPGPPPQAGPAVPGVAFNQVPGAGRPQLGVEIVVKFKDDRKVQDIVDTFWKDQAAAKKKFEAFRQGRPEFAGLKLDRVTYSNELVLAPEAGATAAALRDLATKIGRAPDISYAEPNMVARPGGQ